MVFGGGLAGFPSQYISTSHSDVYGTYIDFVLIRRTCDSGSYDWQDNWYVRVP